MNRTITLSIMSALLGVAGCASQELRPHTRSMLVESPADLPALDQNGGADMFLHDTTNGKTYLYIEAGTGRKLSILDVTDPARIQSVAEVSVAALAPFDYVEEVNTADTLVRYRGNLGMAMLDFSRSQTPSIHQTAQLAGAVTAQTVGDFGLLLTSTGKPQTAPAGLIRTYEVMDTARPGTPALVQAVPGVRRQLTKLDTGTVFLLADNGVTVVRNLRAEEAHALEISVAKQ